MAAPGTLTLADLPRTEVGYNAERLGVTETKDVVTVARSEWSIPKIKEALGGKVVCWPCVISKHFDPESVCPHKGKKGHERGGPLHVIDAKIRDHILANRPLFRPGN